MINRSIAPTIHTVANARLANPESFSLRNNVVVYTMPGGTQPICQLDLVFPAGKWYESTKGAAMFTAGMLTEGTEKYTSEQLANELDYLGSSLHCQSTTDFFQITAYALTQHVPHLLELIGEVLFRPSFPDKELALKKRIRLQKIQVNKQKVEYLASKAFFGHIFGSDHPYGYRLDEADLEAINRETLLNHYQGTIAKAPFFVVAAGELPGNLEALLNTCLGFGNPDRHTWQSQPDDIEPMSSSGHLFVPKEAAQQSALRIGRPLFNHLHPDYKPLKVLNTILGGYFGSRLMSNIREDKGFTYGIYSAVHSYLHGGLFYISTEVGSRYQDAALKEISIEMSRLQEEPVPENELNLVKQYLLGNILGSIDGSLKSAAVIKELIATNQTPEDFNQFIDELQSVEPQKLMKLAQKYLNPQEMVTVIAGSPETQPQ